MSQQEDWAQCRGCDHQRVTLGRKDCNHPRWPKLREIEREALMTGRLPCTWHTGREASKR